MSTTLSKKDTAKILSDRNYWRQVGALLGLELIGFTDRFRATFSPPDGVAHSTVFGEGFECPNYVAERLRHLFLP